MFLSIGAFNFLMTLMDCFSKKFNGSHFHYRYI